MKLSELLSGWIAYGFDAKSAVRELVQIHLAFQNAKGHGNKARRRARTIAAQR